MPPITRAFISPEEVYRAREVTYAEIAALAATLNRAEALHFLGFLNLLLSSATAEAHLTNQLEPVRDVQTWLFREVVSEALLKDLKEIFRDASLLDRPILHRSQMFFAIRVVATHGDAGGGNMLREREDFDAVGNLLFLINGLFKVPPATSKAAEALWLATQMGPLHELENPPTIELSWPRTEELLTSRLPAAATDPEEMERLEQITVFTTGFNLRAWLDLSWMFFSFWAAVKFRELMADRGRGYLDPNRPHDIISNDILRRAVDGLAARFEDVPAHLRIDAYSRSVLFDLTPFRTKPLWIMPDGPVLCVDSPLLLDRLGPHVFWGVMNALDTPERRKQFTATWGLAFERYCLDALQQVFRAKKWFYQSNPIDESINEELWDALASRDTTAIVFECKGTFMRSADKYSGIPGRFLRGLTLKFGNVKHGGVYQLVRGISRVWFRRVAQSPIAQPNSITDVFPVLIAQDPVLNCGPVARVLSDRFQVAIRRAQRRASHKTPTIWALTVISADEVDLVSAGIQATGQRLDALLKRFHRKHPSRIVSFGDFLSSGEAADFGFPDKGKVVIRERFTSGTQATLQRFRNADYGRRVDALADEQAASPSDVAPGGS